MDRCAEAAQKVCSCVVELHSRAQHCIEPRRAATNPNIAQSEPATRPPSFTIPIFGIYNGTGDGYLCSKKDEIE